VRLDWLAQTLVCEIEFYYTTQELRMRTKYARKRLFIVMYRSPQARNQEGAKHPLEKFSSPQQMCWTSFETIGHRLKNCPPRRKLFPLWCPKLVTGLEVQQTYSFPAETLSNPECFYAKKAVSDLVQQLYHATEIANVANAVSACADQP